jgi:hypothetical protein
MNGQAQRASLHTGAIHIGTNRPVRHACTADGWPSPAIDGHDIDTSTRTCHGTAECSRRSTEETYARQLPPEMTL